MNIFKQEFKMKIKSTIIWSLSMGSFMVFYMAFYPAMAKDAVAFESIMNSFPKEMLLALGLSETLSLASLMGYFALTFTMVQLAIAIQSAIYGVSILSEEERELTADFLLSKPVSRSEIYLSKLFAAIANLLISAITVGVSMFVALALFNGNTTFNFSSVIMLVLTIPIFQLVFLSVGMLVSLMMKKVRSVLSLAMGLSISLYVINSVSSIIDNNILALLSPFYYFEANHILVERSYNLSLLVLAIMIIITSLATSYYLYINKDISTL